MKVDNDMGVVSEEEDFGIDIALEHPIYNYTLYTVMRVVRLVLTVACEIVGLAAAVGVGISAALSAGWFALGWIGFVGSIASTIVDEPASWSNIYTQAVVDAYGPATTSVLHFMVCYPFIPLALFIVALSLAWGQALAFGVPYRWKNKMPGLAVVRCDHCGKDTTDSLRCSECNKLRLWVVAMKLILGVNIFITGVWVTHDLFVGLGGFVGGK